MKHQFKTGDTVLLMFGTQKAGTTRELRKHDGQQFQISRIGLLANIPIYELDGCVSKAGTPFTILEDWIVPYMGGK